MKQFFIFIFLVFLTGKTIGCDIYPGKMQIDSTNIGHKIYMSEQPVWSCYPIPDSIRIRIKLLCLDDYNYQSVIIGTKDTLLVELDGYVSIGYSVLWYNNGKHTRTDVPPICINSEYDPNFECFSIIDTLKLKLEPVDTNNTVIIQPVTSVIEVNEGVIMCNTPAKLMVLTYPSLEWYYIKEYDSPFEYQIDYGSYYIYLLLNNGEYVFLGVIDNGK